MTNKELIDAFHSQTKYVKFGKFLEAYLPEEEEVNEKVYDTDVTAD